MVLDKLQTKLTAPAQNVLRYYRMSAAGDASSDSEVPFVPDSRSKLLGKGASDVTIFHVSISNIKINTDRHKVYILSS